MSELHVPGGTAPASPQARYILPSFVERTSYGVKESNPYNKLFEERIIFLGVQIDDASANDVMAQLLFLESNDPDRDITMYINSPGGSFTALMAIYDTMQYVRPDIQTVCLGQAASAAAVILAAGAPGKRLAVPNARVMIHQPATEGFYGQVSDLEIQANEISRMRRLMEETLARHTNQTARAGPHRRRARQDPDGPRGQGVRAHRRRRREPEALRDPLVVRWSDVPPGPVPPPSAAGRPGRAGGRRRTRAQRADRPSRERRATASRGPRSGPATCTIHRAPNLPVRRGGQVRSTTTERTDRGAPEGTRGLLRWHASVTAGTC